MSDKRGMLIKPYNRLSTEQIELIHKTSLAILNDPGIMSYSEKATELFKEAGAIVKAGANGSWNISLPEQLVDEMVRKCPSVVTLGARKEDNVIQLEAWRPSIHFATGSESNNWLEMSLEPFVSKSSPETEMNIPVFTPRKGTAKDLCTAARICDRLDNVDAFIRTVNLQDEDITEQNKDVNKFFASLNNMTKHVMSGLTDVSRIDDVMKLAEIVAGDKEALKENPIVSFITCVTKSPLQLVDDAVQKMIAVVERGMPLVISSSPQGGSTAPIQEAGMVAQINAEILAGITLAQLVREGAPVLYGSVPVRARMDNLHDMYGAPEFCQYNASCAQMARFYQLPCYSTAGVADSGEPGLQAAIEKMYSYLYVGLSGAQYIHYAFGLLERTSTFSPEQAVIDNELVGMCKFIMREPDVTPESCETYYGIVKKVMQSSHKLYTRYVRRDMRSGKVYLNFPLESENGAHGVLINAHRRVGEILAMQPEYMPKDTVSEIYREVPGLLERLNPYRKEK